MDRSKLREPSAALPAIGSRVGGRVRLDVVAPTVVRVRYAEGVWRGPANARISPMQATGRDLGPEVRPPQGLLASGGR